MIDLVPIGAHTTHHALLSLFQEQIWLVQQALATLDSHQSYCIRLKGPLHRSAFEQSLNAVILRHDVLHTGFVQRADATSSADPIPHVQQDHQVAMLFRDLCSSADQELTLALEIDQQFRRPFDLAQSPLLRAALFQMAADEHILCLTCHKLVFDPWSLGILVKELCAFYDRLAGSSCAGRPAQLPTLPIQYSDFAAWQRSQGELFKTQLEYWSRQLSSPPAALRLLPDQVAWSPQPGQEATHSFQIAQDLAEAMAALSNQQAVSPFIVLLAVFQIVLHRYTGQSDLIIGTRVNTRRLPGSEHLIGCFGNTLLLRTDLSGNPTFPELLRRVEAVCAAATTHQDVPFELVIDALPDGQSTPTAQIMFELHSSVADALAGVTLTHYAINRHPLAVGCDLALMIMESDGDWAGSISYRAGAFERATVVRLVDHVGQVLAQVIAQPDQPLATLPLLTDAEAQFLQSANAATTSVDPTATLMTLIAAQVARAPLAPALTCAAIQLSYIDLHAQVLALAAYLQTLGVAPEVRVALCLPRTPRLIIAMLAVLAAGGTYVPLDPTYPPDRLAFMVDDSQATLLLTEAALRHRVARPELATCCLDSAWPAIAATPPLNAPAPVDPANLAYLIYTSGSTGRPKAVAITHHNAVALLAWVHRVFTPAQLAGVLAATSVCFDLSIFELFAPLTVGGRVILVENALALAGLEAAAGVTLVNTVPSAIAELLRQDGIPASVTTVNLAGEPLPLRIVQALYARDHVQAVYNLYGPSEDTTYSTVARMARGLVQAPEIGRPIANTQAYVLDRGGQLVPVGVAGELYLGGAGVARGYLGRPDLTAERFGPDPFSGVAGARLYRTGDLVRWSSAGELAYLGRLDQQVKVRGYRVELGEIGAVLAGHAGVRESVVVVQADRQGATQVVGYVVLEDAGTRVSTLRAWLGQQLPEYMVPSVLVVLEALPLTPNGKIDRRALPPPDVGREQLDTVYVAPSTKLEEQLVQIWSTVLGIPRVGVDDSFFELGGHSLLATQVLTRLRSSFGIDLPMAALFAAPTIAALAEAVTAARTANLPVAIPPLLPRSDRAAPLPLSYAQRMMWLFEQMSPGTTVYHLPTLMRLDGVLDLPALTAALQALIHRHAALRTIFPLHTDQPLQVVLPEQTIPLPVIDLRELPADQRTAHARNLANAAARQPFDLAHGPLLRVTLYRLTDTSALFLLSLHHSISDGWSQTIVFHELSVLYRQHIDSSAVPGLPDLVVEYPDFSVWQQAWMADGVLVPQLAYWRHQLANLPPCELPSDRPRPARPSYRGGQIIREMPAELVTVLEKLSQRAGVTLYMTLLTAFAAVVQRYTGQTEVVVGSPIASRTRAEIEGLIGCFVNTLVLRIALPAEATFESALAGVREVALAAYAHQDVPLAVLAEQLQPNRDPSRLPFYQILFGVQNTPFSALNLSGIEAIPLDLEREHTVADLVFLVEETSQGLRQRVEYNSDLFERATIARLVDHVGQVLAQVIAQPDQPLATLPLLTDAEAQFLQSANAATTSVDPTATLMTLIAAQVARAPLAPALTCAAIQLSYIDLHAQVLALAAYLQTLGVAPEVRVALCLPRTPRLIIAMLAVLAAGGTYVPLDPTYPPDRLAFMVDDSQATLLLTEAALRHRVARPELATCCLDSAWPAIAATPPLNAPAPVDPANLAYLIYTSGSTGRPKAVAITHHNAVALLAWVHRVFTPAQLAGVLAATSVCFDLSIFELFAPLTVGGRVILVENALALAGLEAAAGVTLVNTVPSAIAELLRQDGIPASVTTVNLAGEPLPLRIVQALYARDHVQAVYNLYGPSEDTTYSTVARMARGLVQAPEIGRPIANTQAYVLDRGGQLVPVGVAGELYLGGAGVARGYLGRPDLTAERFGPDPFSGVAGARLYRTGDLVRWSSAGELAYLGRLDQQVKVRGYRVELGEIGAVLAGHAGVRESVVVVQADRQGATQVVGYVVLEDAGTRVSTLRAWLGQQLPEYMVPSVLVVLEALPLTPNGKIDRRALPPPDEQPTAEVGFEEPQTAVEQVLSIFWNEVLGLSLVSRHANFFELGGHSLLATQIASRISQTFQIAFQVRSLFEAPTIVALAQFLITTEPRPGQTEKIAQIYQKIKLMSAANIRNTLDQQKSKLG